MLLTPTVLCALLPGGPTLLAHGGAAGLALEIGLLVVPIVVFVILAVWSGRRNRAAEEAEPPGAPPE